MSRIFWDTNLYIYLFEGHPQFTAPTSELRRRMIERGDELLTSSMTLAEVQVKALRANQPDLARRLSELVSSTSQVIAFDQGSRCNLCQTDCGPRRQAAGRHSTQLCGSGRGGTLRDER